MLRSTLAFLLVALSAPGCFDLGTPLSGDTSVDTGMGGSDSALPDSGPGTDSGDVCIPMCTVDETVVGPIDYATEIEPLFTGNCSNGPCHTGGMGGTEILTAGVICTNTVNVVAEGTMGSSMMVRITPGDPEMSYLFHKLRGTHRCAGVDGTGQRMPFGAPCLSPQQLGTIRAWILDGASCL